MDKYFSNFKFHFFYYNLENLNVPKDKFYKIEGDAPQYVYSAENVVQGKDYTFFKTNSKDYIFKSNFSTDYDKGIYYAFRTPGFAFIYILLRFAFSFNTTLVIILLLQIVLSAIAKYLLAKLGFLIFLKNQFFISSFP